MSRKGKGERDVGHRHQHHHHHQADAFVLLSWISVREDVEGGRDESYLESEEPRVQLGLGVHEIALQGAQILEKLGGERLGIRHRVLQLAAPLHQIAQLYITFDQVLFQILITHTFRQ